MKMLTAERELRDLSSIFATPRGREEYRDAITAFERDVRADEREKMVILIAERCRKKTLEKSVCGICGEIIAVLRKSKQKG